MKFRSALLALWLLAAPADASVWKKWCGLETTGALFSGQYACAVPTSNSDDTEILSVGACDNIDVGLVEDSNGDATGATALTATLQWCPTLQTDATVNTDAKRDAACVNFVNGTLTGDGALQGAGAPSGYVRLNFGGTFAGDPKVFVRCNR